MCLRVCIFGPCNLVGRHLQGQVQVPNILAVCCIHSMPHPHGDTAQAHTHPHVSSHQPSDQHVALTSCPAATSSCQQPFHHMKSDFKNTAPWPPSAPPGRRTCGQSGAWWHTPCCCCWSPPAAGATAAAAAAVVSFCTVGHCLRFSIKQWQRSTVAASGARCSASECTKRARTWRVTNRLNAATKAS